ncbi:hypothetical protein [Legionella jamestowniensis]|uniref:Transmembrane protein n=1 Tax=Legionella jamestowniensis TaxID=455 RepID=A0A0W0UJV7_9GAMM|nr:hypothetical protein [Legionella jamestowniensis]KTD08012.1 hypothetical protein Ljam_2207 [Legionella jamestowniensis]OCH97301.1 hypothetical protein A8135_03320 [Legionella jamestowniensis]SFM06611.1 hypothetical protein SAMN02746073_0225 [Legionella jamestowniensis DSM 19215]
MANENLLSQLVNAIWYEGKTLYTQHVPGFFTAYRSAKDVMLTLSAPVYAPFVFTLATALTGAIAVLATLICAGAYLTAGISKVVGKTSVARDAWDIGSFCGVIAAVAAILLPCSAFLSLISLPYSVAHLTIRSGISVASKLVEDSNSQAAAKSLSV